MKQNHRAQRDRWLNKTSMNESALILSAFKPRHSLTHHANKSSRWVVYDIFASRKSTRGYFPAAITALKRIKAPYNPIPNPNPKIIFTFKQFGMGEMTCKLPGRCPIPIIHVHTYKEGEERRDRRRNKSRETAVESCMGWAENIVRWRTDSCGHIIAFCMTFMWRHLPRSAAVARLSISRCSGNQRVLKLFVTHRVFSTCQSTVTCQIVKCCRSRVAFYAHC